MVEYAAREGNPAAPRAGVGGDPAERRRTGVRAWVRLYPGEVAPCLVSGDRPITLVWSSLWPDRPDDLVEFTLRPHGMGTRVEVVMTGAEEPQPEQASYFRRRLGELVYGELRLAYDQ
jgi:hypothetical protein